MYTNLGRGRYGKICEDDIRVGVMDDIHLNTLAVFHRFSSTGTRETHNTNSQRVSSGKAVAIVFTGS